MMVNPWAKLGNTWVRRAITAQELRVVVNKDIEKKQTLRLTSYYNERKTKGSK